VNADTLVPCQSPGVSLLPPLFPIRDRLPTRLFPFVNYALIAVNVLVFLFEISGPDQQLRATNGHVFDVPWQTAIVGAYGFVPCEVRSTCPLGDDVENVGARAPVRFPHVPVLLTVLTAMFLHGGWAHIGFNMLFLWIFGNNVEDLLGGFRYLALYFASGVAAALAQALPDFASDIPMIGASGAIAGVLGAYLMLYPRANVHVFVWIIIFFRIVNLPAWLILGFWFLMQVLDGLSAGTHTAGVAVWAHAGGFVTGIVLIMLLRPYGVQLLRALLQWTQRLLTPFPSGLQLHLSQLLRDRGLTLAFLFFSQPLLSEALLLRPELLLHQAFPRDPTPLVRPKILFDGVKSSPLFRRTPLLRPQFGAKLDHPHAVAQRETLSECLRSWQRGEYAAQHHVDEFGRYGLASRLQSPRRIGGELCECFEHRLTNAAEVRLVRVLRVGQPRARTLERPLELRPGAPGQPAVRRSLEQCLEEPEVVAVAMQSGVGLRRRAQERQAITIGYETAPWRVEGEVRPARQRDAERLPIQAAVEQPEIRCVNIDEHPAGVQHGKIERQALNARSGQSQLVSGAGCSRVDGSAAVNRDQDAAISIAIG